MQVKRIVVADDEAHIRHIVTMKLRNAGFEVINAADGEEALDLCLQDRPHLLVTDYQMPRLSGLDLCKRLKLEPVTRELRAIMLTARGFDLSDEDLAATNIAALMSKPFSPREILDRVKQLLAAQPVQG